MVDRLTKSAHFLDISENSSVKKLAEVYIREVVARHGVPTSIVSVRDVHFTSKFWKKYHEELGTRLHFSTAYHLQIDGQSERTIQTLEDMLHTCVMHFGGSWDSYLLLAEFSYNNNHHSRIGMPPFKFLYGRRCRTPICWGEVGQIVMGSTEIVLKTTERIQQVSPWKRVIRFRKQGKLDPRFIGPFRVIARVGKLRKCVADETVVVPLEDIQVDDHLNYIEKPVAILDRKVYTLRNKEKKEARGRRRRRYHPSLRSGKHSLLCLISRRSLDPAVWVLCFQVISIRYFSGPQEGEADVDVIDDYINKNLFISKLFFCLHKGEKIQAMVSKRNLYRFKNVINDGMTFYIKGPNFAALKTGSFKLTPHDQKFTFVQETVVTECNDFFGYEFGFSFVDYQNVLSLTHPQDTSVG
uniref:Integrase catalytic domain-containing protein n=1 Tax=Lactuca sativa TaxID=4236 RepID=A0A9R1XML6_LACSA|nr:hypothetical protein LSAT_V11C200070630 [Lactuca sativa]